MTAVARAALAALAGAGATLAGAGPALAGEPAAPRLIHHGWALPSPAFVRRHVREMEALPFDGTTIRLEHGEGRVFGRSRWDERKLEPEIRDLEATRWERFTANCLLAYAASEMDWWSDADWAVVTSNLRLLARAARRGRIETICFDPEPYGRSPWDWRRLEHRDERSFAEHEAVVRRRGAEFLRALARELPDVQLLVLFLAGGLFDAASRPAGAIPGCAGNSPLENHPYGLLPAFEVGLLDAARGRVRIVDGNEPAYYYTAREAFYRAYHALRSDAACLVEPALRPRRAAHLLVGQAVFVDETLGLRGPDRPAARLTPAERLQWLEHNVYHALAASDGVAWIYSEQMSFWSGERVPVDAVAAIRRARDKLERSQPLGFDLAGPMARARGDPAR